MFITSPIPPVPIGSNRIVAEALTNTNYRIATVQSKYHLRNMKANIKTKGEKTFIKVESKFKGMTTSKVHAETHKRLTAIEGELFDTKMLLTSTTAELAAEKKLRAEAERKQLEAEAKIKALTQEAQIAKNDAIAAEAARASAEHRSTRFGEDVIASKQEYDSIAEGVKALKTRWDFEQGAHEEYLKSAESDIKEWKAKFAESEQKRAAAEKTEEQYSTLLSEHKKLLKNHEGLYEKSKSIATTNEELKTQLQAVESDNADLQSRLEETEKRCDEQGDRIVVLEDDISELKGDMFVLKGKLSNTESTLSSALESNAKVARSGLEQQQRANKLHVSLKQSITTLKQILPADTPVAPETTLVNLTRLIVEHHQDMLQQVATAQANEEDIRADFKARDKQMRATVALADRKFFEASAMSQHTSSLQARLAIAQQHASKLPKLQADHDKHFNAAKQLHADRAALQMSVDKYGKMINDLNIQMSGLKQEIAESNLRTGGDDGETVEKLKREPDLAIHEPEQTKIELRQARKT